MKTTGNPGSVLCAAIICTICCCAIADDPNSRTEFPGADNVTCYEDLVRYAELEALKPYQPEPPLPECLAKLDYETFREIQFDPEAACWKNSSSPFLLETFHRGFVQKNRVDIFTVEDDAVRPLPFSSRHFKYGKAAEEVRVPETVGHAGLRVVGRLPGQQDAQEMLTFLGASYFRGRSLETVYGSSARGLAIDIAMNKPEEFPAFRKLWVRRCNDDDDCLCVLAHMDSPSVSGAFEFRFEPGSVESTLHVKSFLNFRKAVEKVAIAPLTSMWIWGDGLNGPPLDKRPACHDAGGLLVRSEEEGWNWRPFARQAYPSVSYQPVKKLDGFGVLQRNRSFYHYDDYNALYHKRPSVWVTPQNAWRNGKVELLELPGAHEGVDNIAAYWIPEIKPQAGDCVAYDYKVSFFPGDHGQQNYVGRATNFEVSRDPESSEVTLEIRFSGEALKQICDTAERDLETVVVNGEIIEKDAISTENGDWIVTVRMVPTTEAPIDLHLCLKDAGRSLTETFSYLCPPQQPEFEYPQVYTRRD